MRPLSHAFLAAAVLAGCASPPVVAVKPGVDFSRIGPVALLDFEDYPGQAGSGRIASQSFEPYLLKAGYSLVERSQVDRILQEQSFSRTGAVDPGTVAALGRILGVEALILGNVTSLAQDRSVTYMQSVQNVAYEPVYNITQYQDRHGNIRTRQEVAQYDVTTTNDQIPVTYSTPALLGVSARMVAVKTGELLWTGSFAAEGASLGQAADRAARALLGALKDAWPSRKPRPPAAAR